MILRRPAVESCGLLIGCSQERQWVVERFAFCTNLSGGPDAFILAPRDYFRVAAGLGASEAIVGIFHSHHGRAVPSPADVENMKLHPFVWLIIGNTASAALSDLVCRAYRLNASGRLAKIGIDVVHVDTPDQ